MLDFRPRCFGVLALILCTAPFLAAEERPALKVLTPALRARIDKQALQTESVNLKQEGINLAGNATAFLISQTTLAAEEEANLAGLMHKQLLKQQRTLPTPPAAQRILDRVLDQLPAHLKPEEFRYRLTILDVPEAGVFTWGGGYLYLTRPLLEHLLDGTPRGESALAFVLAQQLGHVGLLHCRRGWQLAQIQDDLKEHFKPDVESGLLPRLLETSVRFSGPLTYFLYSRNQSYATDVFAWQVCRNARIDSEQALDALRYAVLVAHPRLLTEEDYRPTKANTIPVLEYLSECPEPLARLKRMLMERDGLVGDDKEYGLFRYDVESGELTRCGNGSIRGGEAPIVFLHGLRGDRMTFRDFLVFLGKQKETAGRPLLVFRYPNNDSLARGGLYLHNEIKRVVTAPEKAAFICHSAGGLVFRFYAEIKKGAFAQAFLLATPHLGSQMTALKFLVDVTEFAGALSLGLPAAIAATVPEGRGEMSCDLLPDSLFLRFLGQDAVLSARYQVFCGQCLDPVRGFALRSAIVGGKQLLKEQLVSRFKSPVLRERADGLLDRLRVPEEVLHGDGVVTVRSASLKNAGKVTRMKLDHLGIKQDEKVMQQVLEALAEQ